MWVYAYTVGYSAVRIYGRPVPAHCANNIPYGENAIWATDTSDFRGETFFSTFKNTITFTKYIGISNET